MHKSSTLEEVLRVGKMVEVSVISIDLNYLGEKYVWIREYPRVTKITKNKKREITNIRLAGRFIKSIKVSRETEDPLHATIRGETVKVNLEIIPDKI